MATVAELGPGRDGEICIHGSQVTKRYLNKRHVTVACMDDAGFLRIGDVGRFDAEGQLFVVDRVKELIKHEDFQAPADLEAEAGEILQGTGGYLSTSDRR